MPAGSPAPAGVPVASDVPGAVAATASPSLAHAAVAAVAPGVMVVPVPDGGVQPGIAPGPGGVGERPTPAKPVGSSGTTAAMITYRMRSGKIPVRSAMIA